jgi:peptide/nickel transport system substrate-binding protein
VALACASGARRMPPRHRFPLRSLAVALAAALAIVVGAGCSDDEGGSAGGSVALPGSGGTLEWAFAEAPRELDPLLARSRADQLVARQIYEPLTAKVESPYGEGLTVDGLATAHHRENNTVWVVRLRHGITFQDGTPFDAGAVVANARRWLATAAGRALLPDLVRVEDPRSDLALFFLNGPNPDFGEVLRSPRLGIVSPESLPPRPGRSPRIREPGAGGTGPFELSERGDGLTVIARNVGWWGSARELGPFLDEVEFQVVPGADERFRLLKAGAVQAADDLGPEQLARVRSDPLLTVAEAGGGDPVGLERSVRGIGRGAGVPSLSGVWLTRIGVG